MPSATHTLIVCLTALAVAVPAALASPADLRTPDSRATASDDGTKAALATERYYSSFGNTAGHPSTPSDDNPSQRDAALATGRYYSTFETTAQPLARTDSAPAAGDDGIAELPFALAISGALALGLAAGFGVHVVQVRRRAGTGVVA
jgi:hypothetical protein